MADFVGDHISLGEVARSAKLLHLVPETQVQVYLGVCRTIKRSGRGLRCSATGIGPVAKQNHVRPGVANTFCSKDFGPGILGVIQHKRSQLRCLVFLRRDALRRPLLLSLGSSATVGEIGANIVSSGYQADDRQDNQSHQPEAAAAEPAAGVSSPVLNVAA